MLPTDKCLSYVTCLSEMIKEDMGENKSYYYDQIQKKDIVFNYKVFNSKSKP